MNVVVLLVRLPFFCVALIGMTLMLCAMFAVAAIVWFLVIPPLWVVSLPVKFVEAAFRNDLQILTTHVSDSVSSWWSAASKAITEFPTSYRSLWHWLLQGDDGG